MGTPRKWTESAITAEAKKYTTRTSFKQQASGAVKAAIKLGIYEKVCGHMQSERKWTVPLLEEEAHKYTTRTEFARLNAAAYGTAINKGILDDICSHMPTTRCITRQEAIDFAKKFNKPSEVSAADISIYGYILRNKLRDIAFEHMGGKYKSWDEEALTEEASKYDSWTSFRKNNAYAFTLYKRLKLPLDIYTPMPIEDPFNIGSNVKGVYMLKDNGSIVYIGKTLTCIRGRVNSHLHDKVFDTVEILQFKNLADIHIIEFYLIGLNLPKYNKEATEASKTTVHISNLDEVLLSKTLHTRINNGR